MSESGRPFDLRSVSPISAIDYNAPTLAALTHRGACFKKITTKRPYATPSVAAATLVQAFKVTTLIILIMLISIYIYTIFSGHNDCNWDIISNSPVEGVNWGYPSKHS